MWALNSPKKCEGMEFITRLYSSNSISKFDLKSLNFFSLSKFIKIFKTSEYKIFEKRILLEQEVL